jgi:hypothetical protein
MDVNAIANSNSVLKATETGDAVKLEVARKAMALQKQHATDLVNAIPKPPKNPPHLGQSIDVHV